MEEPFWTSGMTLYTDENSAEGHVLRLLIAEKECPCNVHIIRGELPPQVRQINPGGSLPFLTDKMLALFDYHSIVMYLQERFPAAEFLPEHPKLRAQIRQVCALLKDYAAIADSGSFTPGWLQQTLNEIDGLLDPQIPWLLGEEFTLADIFASALLYRLARECQTVRISVTLGQYEQRLFSRRSFKESLHESLEQQAA